MRLENEAMNEFSTQMNSGAMALALAAVHIFASRLKALEAQPRSRWLSAAGGVSVAYVFLELLPELHRGQHTLERATASSWIAALESHVYAIALLGLAIFYGLERLAKCARRQRQSDGQATAGAGVFWTHIVSFGAFNALIGCLLHERDFGSTQKLLLFAVAIGLHFVVNDYGLRQHHRHRYDRLGRWILAVAVIVGWIVGALVVLHQPTLAVVFAFLAGAIILNALEEELPEERESRFWSFALGGAGYAALIL